MHTTTQIKVRGYHEDRFQHVNNARYLEFLEDGRWDHFDQRGLDDGFFDRLGIFPVVVRITISYRRPAHAGDTLSIATRVVSAGSWKIVIGQTVVSETTGKPCVDAEVTVVFLSKETGRPVSISDEMRRAWPDLENAGH